MKKNKYFIILFLLLAFCANIFSQGNSDKLKKNIHIHLSSSITSKDSVVRNKLWEHTLYSSSSYSNPYKDIVVNVHFYNEESSKTYDSYGFWDGDSTFKIRSSFPTTGIWFWETVCSNILDVGLHNKSGSVLVTEYNGTNKIYKHGALKIATNNKYITYTDDTPFLWMGGTAWGLPISATYQEWKKYIDDRHSKKFSIVQIAPARIHGGIWLDPPIQYPSNQVGDKSFFSDDKWNPIYWQEFDRFVEYANSKEIIIVVVGLAEPVYDILSIENAKYFARNFGARMEGYHVILSPAFDTWQSSQNSTLDSIGIYLTNSRHLISQHTGHTYAGKFYNEFAKYFRNKSYMDFSINQTGHNSGDLEVCYRKAREWNIGLLNEPPKKYVVNTEAYYSSGTYSSRISHSARNGTDENARAIGWLGWLSGSLGYSYGATGLWNYGEETDDNLIIPLDSAISFESSAQMEYMVDFFNSIYWWKLVPKHSAIISNEWDETKKMAFAIADDGKFGAAFLPNNNSIKLDMTEFSNKVNAFWFNPKNGIYSKAEQNISNLGEYTFTPSSPGEWTLLLNCADSIDALWIQNISISDNSNNPIIISFGKAIGATDSIDIVKGEVELQSTPPNGIYDVRFILDSNSTTLLDLRNNEQTEIVWTIKFQPSSSGYPIFFSWDKNNFPYGNFFLRDVAGGTLVNINMKLNNHYQLTNESIKKMQIVYSQKFTSTINHKHKWDLMSIPLQTENMNINHIFSDSNTLAFGYNRKYFSVENLHNGKGYWINSSKKGQLDIYGDEPSNQINITAGWNLVGAYSKDLNINAIQTNPSGIICKNIYGYENTYYITDTLKVGKGYWVKSKGVGQIDFTNTSGLDKVINKTTKEPLVSFNIIASDGISDGISLIFGLDSLATDTLDAILNEAELPPAPPTSVFDARIQLPDTLITSYSDIRYFAANCYEHILNYQLGDSSNGLVLNWNLPKGVTLNIKDVLGGNVFNKNFNSGQNSFIVTDSNINSLTLTFCYSDIVLSKNESETIPTKYSLEQNYPNPFNPSTKIKFELPKESNVTLTIYNILGEQIIRLIDEKLKAGYYEKELKNFKYSSGVYFYRLQTDSFVKTRKMILLQ